MNPLQYTSEEMFSSTELIRKSKMVFDKLQDNNIEKAIILRDGKPSFMLLDFSKYEKIMSEYIFLKEKYDRKSIKQDIQKPLEKTSIEEPIEKIVEKEDLSNEVFEAEDYETALAQIDELDLGEIAKKPEEPKEPLKEFWE